MSSYFKFLCRVRIHGRECGAVARALRHKIEANPLSAADKKVLSTTNERKVMSKTTFFKRIALTAIAALGLGMLSVAPSQAAAGAPSVTVSNGTAEATQPTTGAGETSTAATVSITGLTTTANDSYTVSVYRKSAPDSALADGAFHVLYVDTVTYSATRVDTDAQQGNGFVTTANAVDTAAYDSKAVGTANVYHFDAGAASGYAGAKFGIMVDSGTNRTGSEGDYVFTVVVTPVSAGTPGTSVSTDVTLTINASAADVAAASTTIDPAKTKAVMNTLTTVDTTTADASVAVVATASTKAHATIAVYTYNNAGVETPESITVTVTGPGVVGESSTSAAFGKRITLAGDGSTAISIRADGTAGIASIVVATTTVTFPAKSVIFYASTPASIVASTRVPVIKAGTNEDVITAKITDANGNLWAGSAYIYASTAADALIAGSNATPVLCAFDSGTDQRHECDVTGIAAGTANFKIINASTVAAATVTSNEVSTRVSAGTPGSVVLSFDKSEYAPGEKAQVRISVLDGAGLAMAAQTIANVFATGGITVSRPFSVFTADSLTATSATLQAATSSSSNTNAGHQTIVVNMPTIAGAVTISATGGTGLAPAGRVAVSASATVVDATLNGVTDAANAATDAASEAIDAANAATDAANLAAEAADAATVAAEEARDAADAATAAVEALATEVATLMAALKAQITTLANTVAKIAKKVKA